MGITAATELKLTMRPAPAFLMWGRTAELTRTVPKKFTSNCFLAAFMSVNSAAPDMPKPALFTRMSILPFSAIICEMAAYTLSVSVMSQVMWVMPSAVLPVRLSSNTVQPKRLSCSAVSFPIPELPPVTTAIFDMERTPLFALYSSS